MPIFDLKLKAELENVESVSANEDTIWRTKIECSNCHEVSPSFVEISSKNQVDVIGTRGTCNCLYTCKACKRKIQIDVVPKSWIAYSTSEKWGKVVSFELRGGQPCKYQPADGFCIVTESGTTFKDVDLQDDFADYDEDAGEAVSVINLEWKFV